MSECQHWWHLVPEDQAETTWWIACELCGEYGVHGDVNAQFTAYRQRIAELEERRCNTCLYENELTSLEIGSQPRGWPGLCNKCKASGFTSWRLKPNE